MFRASGAHLQEDTVVHMQHMVLSVCKQVSGRVLLKYDFAWCFGNTRPLTCLQSNSTICCMCTTVSSWRWAPEARNMSRKL